MSVSQEAEQYSTRDEVAIMLGERVKRGERSGGWRMEDRFFNTRPTLNLIAWGFAMDMDPVILWSQTDGHVRRP